MTKQEAVDVLRNAAWLGSNADRDLTEQAVDMAISALEAQELKNSTDTISRQDAIDKAITIPIAKIVTEDKVISRKAVFVEDIEALPPAQQERKKGKCVWCSSPYRIEYYWIDKDGCTASFEDEDRHIVATGIAKYCPNCGRPLETEVNDEGD